MDNKVQSLLGVSMEKIKELVDVDIVMGKPVSTPNGVTIIPVSKVSYGFAGGGSDLPTKGERELFGGGAGTGISVTPIAFLSIVGDQVSVLPIISKPDTTDSAISKVPELVDKLADLWASRKKKSAED